MEKQSLSQEFSRDAIEALYASGYGCYESGNYEHAIHFFHFLTIIDRNTKKHWVGLGASYQLSKKYANAVQCFAYAALLDENDPYIHVHAAECFFALDRTEQGDQALASAEIVVRDQQGKYGTLLEQILLMKKNKR